MVRLIRTFLAVFVVAARRLWSTRGLAFASAAGFIAAVTLAFSVPLYADAVYHRVLFRELGVSDVEGKPRTSPFAFQFRMNVFWQEPSTWQDLQRTDQFMLNEVPRQFQLPRTDFLRYFQTTNLRIYPAATKDFADLANPALVAPILSMTGFGDHIRLVEGRLPVDPGGDSPDQPQPVEVLISRYVAERAGFQVGDRYAAVSGKDLSDAIPIPVVIVGVWEPRDRLESYWIYQPYQLEGMFVAAEEAFMRIVGPRMDKNVAEALWYMDFNGDSVRVWNVGALVDRINGLDALAKSRQVNISAAVSPLNELTRYQRESRALTVQLFAFSIPLFVLVFAFVILVASLSAASQRNEIAVLRSRGATAWQVLGIAFLGACVLGVLALAASAPIALGLAQVIGQTRSFLSFVFGQPLPVSITTSSFPFGLAMMAAAIVLTTLPIIGAARYTIITYKQEQARNLKPPLWQRMWLDVLLLIPAAYWTYLLQRQGTVDIAGVLSNPGSDPFSNPSLFLLPGLAMLAITLFLIRLLPIGLRLIAWVLGRLPGTAMVMASRQLARSPGLYASPTLLLVLTLSQATYTASVAATLDQSLDQQARYTTGADVRLLEIGQDTRPITSPGAPIGGQSNSFTIATDSTESTSNDSEPALPEGPRWRFLPLSDYREVDGVEALARGSYYSSIMYFQSGEQTSARGHFMGIDRLDYPGVAYWRNDFAPVPLIELMNALASTPDAIIVPESVLKDHALAIGDQVQVSIALPEADIKLNMRIVGAFRLWPTWYPNKQDEGPLYIGNLDYIFEMAGGQAPYDIWIKVRPGADPAVVLRDLRNLDSSAFGWRIMRSVIEREQLRPQRQGLFGMLSIGFGAAALLTVAGFILYAAFSWRRRFVEMGVLRAIGLGTGQMATYLGCELALLLGLGLLAGTGIGVVASRIYIPYLQVIATDEARTLPFAVIVNWSSVYGIYAVFGLLFVVALLGLVVFLRRLKIFQAVKLGETA